MRIYFQFETTTHTLLVIKSFENTLVLLPDVLQNLVIKNDLGEYEYEYANEYDNEHVNDDQAKKAVDMCRAHGYPKK